MSDWERRRIFIKSDGIWGVEEGRCFGELEGDGFSGELEDGDVSGKRESGATRGEGGATRGIEERAAARRASDEGPLR